jgi:hypothetical protein
MIYFFALQDFIYNIMKYIKLFEDFGKGKLEPGMKVSVKVPVDNGNNNYPTGTPAKMFEFTGTVNRLYKENGIGRYAQQTMLVCDVKNDKGEIVWFYPEAEHVEYHIVENEQEKQGDGDWVSEKDVEDDYGFYSDLYKDEHGVRPHGHSAEQLARWLNQTFMIELRDGRKMIVKKDERDNPLVV